MKMRSLARRLKRSNGPNFSHDRLWSDVVHARPQYPVLLGGSKPFDLVPEGIEMVGYAKSDSIKEVHLLRRKVGAKEAEELAKGQPR